MGKKKRQSSRRAIQRPSGSHAASKDRKASPAQAPSEVAIRGITNLGNTCFFNSALQALVAAFDLSEWEELPSLKVYPAFVEVMKILRASGHKIINPSQLLSALSTKVHQFNNRRQHDSHELILHLISSMTEELEKRGPPSPHIFQSFFNGTLAGIVQCQHCGYRSCSINKFVDISLEIPGSRHLFRYPTRQVLGAATRALRSKKKESVAEAPLQEEAASTASPVVTSPVTVSPESEPAPLCPVEGEPKEEEQAQQEAGPEGETGTGAEVPLQIVEPPDDPHTEAKTSPENISLFDCLRQYTSREMLTVESGDGYSCPRCSDSSLASEQGEVAHQKRSASKRLLLLDTPSLLIFHFKRLLPGGKCASSISFPLECSLASFIGLRSSASSPCSGPIDPSPSYRLRAVIVHIGGGSGGHYVAYVYRHDQWFFTSDAATRRATEAEVLQSQAYLLMYRRIPLDGEPSPPGSQDHLETVVDSLTALDLAPPERVTETEGDEGTDGEESDEGPEGESEGKGGDL
jgi:ubiquitin C-terminal hydrolase